MRAAIYLRLSKEDKQESIENQGSFKEVCKRSWFFGCKKNIQMKQYLV